MSIKYEGWRPWRIWQGQMVPEFEEAAFALEVGKYMNQLIIVGYHII
ncbi:MAG: peptidylprolyl isomerase [Peptostreptococcus anaerobius]